MEETNTNTLLNKKSQSPSKMTPKEDNDDLSLKKIMTEQIINKNKSFLLTGTLTKDFKDEEELEGISIIFKEQTKKIKLITYDLLLKKIVTENFIEKNPIQIFSFCQQCFCFIDREILFNKIFECYNFYKEKKTPMSQLANLIKFLSILVIEMYEYYSIVKFDEPSLNLLKTFYNNTIFEICELINKEAEEKEENEENFNINDFQNKLEEYNEDEEDNKKDVFKDRNSEYQDDNKEINRERFDTFVGRKEEGRYSSFLDNNNGKDQITRNTINMAYEQYEKEDKKSKKDKKKEEKEKKKEKKKDDEKKKKKGLGLHFFHIKKEKPVKVEDKKGKKENENELKEKFKIIQELKTAPSSIEEEILNYLRNMLLLFHLEEPNKKDLNQAKRYVDFYKDINKKMAEAIGKPVPESKGKHMMAKSVTVGDITKKHKLKLHDNDGFFDVLDWNKKEIGEKLISISKSLINKVQRREIYKAIFLKKDKEKTCPNVMENIDKFNRLTFFIIQDILSYDFAKDRARIMEKWIKIANYCKERRDYNDCVAINSALNNYIITGLKKTNNEIKNEKQEQFKKIKKFCRYQGNYKKLREEMKGLSYTDFYIPYLGMILKDLAFYEEKSEYLVNGILINFEKLENVQLAITDFFHFKNTIDKEKATIPEELNFFEHLEEIKEPDMEKLANDLEPEFKLYTNKSREKRPTNIDKKYFADINVKRPNMRDSKKLTKNK